MKIFFKKLYPEVLFFRLYSVVVGPVKRGVVVKTHLKNVYPKKIRQNEGVNIRRDSNIK